MSTKIYNGFESMAVVRNALYKFKAELGTGLKDEFELRVKEFNEKLEDLDYKKLILPLEEKNDKSK